MRSDEIGWNELRREVLEKKKMGRKKISNVIMRS